MKKIVPLIIWSFLAMHPAHAQTLSYAQNGVTVAGGHGSGGAANQLNQPYGIALDANGNLYIADYYNFRVQKWAPGAAAGVTVAGGNGNGKAANQFSNAACVKLDASGNLYISDIGNHRVQKWAQGAASGVTVAGGNGDGNAANQLTFPSGLFIDASNNLYINDTYNFRVQKWAAGATAGTTVAGGHGEGPAANQLDFSGEIFVDASGNVYVADADNNRIQKWAPGATTGVTVAGGNGAGSAPNQLNVPYGVWVDPSGNIFIADQFNQRIQKWAPGATSGITVAGGNGVGDAPNQLRYPHGICLDAAGNIYVADEQNYRVQRFNVTLACPANVVITAPSCSSTVAINWTEPRDTFPDTIRIPQYLDPNQGTLSYLGARDGHGYYVSTNAYQWPTAQSISEFIGDTGVNGHLVTITSAAEAGFLVSLTTPGNLTPWIGLVSTGKPGNFRWITGEPFSYTNWASGEPNNNAGNAGSVAEPYVHMYSVGIWNDQRSANLRFMTEFEKPLISSRQISGPARGSQQSVGVYMICYERTNTITDQRDTCCFSVTVSCMAAPAAGTATIMSASAGELPAAGLKATVYPNPSSTRFSLNVTSSNPQKVAVRVMDLTGKIVETRSGIAPDQTIVLGSGLKAGVYFVELKQGEKKVQMKMVKQ